jgi:hypothetical protein
MISLRSVFCFRALWGAVEIARTSIRALLRVSESAELLPPALVTM